MDHTRSIWDEDKNQASWFKVWCSARTTKCMAFAAQYAWWTIYPVLSVEIIIEDEICKPTSNKDSWRSERQFRRALGDLLYINAAIYQRMIIYIRELIFGWEISPKTRDGHERCCNNGTLTLSHCCDPQYAWFEIRHKSGCTNAMNQPRWKNSRIIILIIILIIIYFINSFKKDMLKMKQSSLEKPLIIL